MNDTTGRIPPGTVGGLRRCAALALAACAVAGAFAAPTHIHERPHPTVVAHYHPHFGRQLHLKDIRYALEHGVHGIELDLHMRDGEVVANHDGPTPPSPRLRDVMRLIVRYKDRFPTVQRDGRQFFVVIEPKVNDPALFDATVDILEGFAAHLSTAVGPDDAPRGVTVVVTGAHLADLADRFRATPERLNRLCILENRDYSGEIVNLAPGAPGYQWTAIPYPRHRGRVEALHNGTDDTLRGRYSIRVWGAPAGVLHELPPEGVDSINVDHEFVPGFVERARRINGTLPTLSDGPPANR